MSEEAETADFSTEYETVCIGSGALKGILMLGALSELVKTKWWNFPENTSKFVGCSVGAIISLLLCIGCTSEEILWEVLPIETITDLGEMETVSNIIEKKGLFVFDKLKQRLEDIVRRKLGMVPTFSELKYLGKELHVAVTRVALITEKTGKEIKKKSEIWNHDSHPDMNVIHAVMTSCAIPILVVPTQFASGHCHQDGSNVDNSSCSDDNNVFVDGAVACPFPIVYAAQITSAGHSVLGICVGSEGCVDTQILAQTMTNSSGSRNASIFSMVQHSIHIMQDTHRADLIEHAQALWELRDLRGKCENIEDNGNLHVLVIPNHPGLIRSDVEQKAKLFVEGEKAAVAWMSEILGGEEKR